ncbi:MAG: aldo/keto reductase [Gammaproteobacteria bacterium]|nr:aldo/keto reductase [Gammaproteobacteria bacterium]
MKTVRLPAGEDVPALGIGTWRMGESRAMRNEEIAALRLALDLGITLIDTAEMYGNGETEVLVGKAIAGRRDEVFLVSKVLPTHASRGDTVAACECSLRRLKTDRLDLYLLHWPGDVPLAETMEAFLALQRSGMIRHYGVSNLDRADMEQLWSLPRGNDVQTNQLLYNLERRGIEWDLLPWLRERGVPVMAYSPFEQGELLCDRRLASFAERYQMTPAQAALAWLMSQPDIIAIPKSSHRKRVQEIHGAHQVRLTQEQLAELDALFPPPAGAQPLAAI